MLDFVVYGKIMGKQRARTFYDSKTNKMRSITPNETATYENYVRMCYATSCKNFNFGDKPIIADISAFYDIPKSVSKKTREAMLKGEIVPTKKPDTDNIAKIILDSLNKIAYNDDSQVVQLNIRKQYTDGQPYVVVSLWEK